MLCREFSQVTCGDVGEGVMRHAMVNNLERKNRIHMLDNGAHKTYAQAIELGAGPMFTSVRNPFDWYISTWFHRVRNRRFQGPFREWFYKENIVFTDTWHYFAGHDIPKEHVVRFELVEEDFPRILHDIWPDISREEVSSWFPDAFRQWSGRLWSELAEQWLRNDLYTDEMLEQIANQDAELLEAFDYHYDDYYISAIPPN